MSRKYRSSIARSSIARSSTATPSPQVAMPCTVREDAEQRPVAVRLFGEEVGVEAIDGRWEDEEFWWRDDPVVRLTYQVTLENGQQMIIFKNTLTGGWYRQNGH